MISKYIKIIFSEGELEPQVVVAKSAITTPHGAIQGKTQTHEVVLYNLDVIISVDYRVKSKRGITKLLELLLNHISRNQLIINVINSPRRSVVFMGILRKAY